MVRHRLRKIWICTDVWMDIFPFFDRPQLGLKMALLSPRFDVLVDTHFDGKSELPIWNWTMISKDKGPKSKLSVRIGDNFVRFPFPDRPLPNKIRFKHLRILYIDHSVIEFLRSNQQIWNRKGSDLCVQIGPDESDDTTSIWDVFTCEIWPVFATNIRQLSFSNCHDLDSLRQHISPTILTDLDQLNSIDSVHLFPNAIGDFDGPNATFSAGQALSKWLHTPSKSGQPKRLFCEGFIANLDLINGFKETFLRATTSVSYKIRIVICLLTKPIEPFELVNERTKEMLIFEKILQILGNSWLWRLKRCPIIAGKTAATDQWEDDDENWDDNLNNVKFNLCGGRSSTAGTRPQRKKKNKKKMKRAKALKRRRTARK